MNLKRSAILSLVAAICLGTVAEGLSARSKILTTDEGQVKLMQEINAGQKSDQLTLKEATKLRKNMARVARKKAKMLTKTGRQLTAAETATLKDDLAKVSDDLHKLEREKTTPSR